MHFEHSGEIWRDFPELVPGVLFADGLSGQAVTGDRTAAFTAVARSRLANGPEAELPEIQAWRRAFSRMGLKPTQYRCASESLLRRLRKEGDLPELHPLVDLCNSISLAFAIPVAVFDVSKVTGELCVRYADGDEDYLTFSGETEHPAPHEVIFADAARQVHARRWTNRQSGWSAVTDSTTAALDRGGGDARLRRLRRAGTHRGRGRRTGGRLVRHPGAVRAQPLLAAFRVRPPA